MTMPMLAGASRMRPPPEFNGYLWWDFTKRHSLPPGFGYIRGGNKLQYNPFYSGGKYVAYGPNIYAPDYDPLTGLCRGFRSETAATNLLQWSSNLSVAKGWGFYDCSPTEVSGGIISSGVAARLTINNTTASHNVRRDISFTSGSTYTAYWVVKYTGSQRYVQITTSAPLGYAHYNFDLQTGTQGVVNAGGATGVSGIPVNLGSGYYLLPLTFTSPATTSSHVALCFSYSLTAPAAAAHPGDGVSHFEVHHAQLVSGTRVSSPIVTLGATAARQADVMQMLTLPAWFDQTKYTLFAEVELEQASDTQAGVLAFSDGSAANRSYLRRSATGFDCGVVVGSATQASIAVADSYAGVKKMAASLTGNDFRAVNNGVAGAADTSGSMPTINRIFIGSDIGGNFQANGWVRRIGIAPRTMTTAELQALTA